MKRPLVFFYLLVIYVLLQFSWWAYLLIDLNQEVYMQRFEHAVAEHGLSPDKASAALKQKVRERWFMVAGEGIVFLTILILGIYKTRDAFRKEFALARQQRNFLLSITHEFKSPLAAIKLNLQTLQKRTLNNEQQNSIINNAITESDRINNLIENALLAARIESHNFSLQMEYINLADCIRNTFQSRIIPGRNTHRLELNLEENVFISGDPAAIESMLLNLFENAQKYSPEDSTIRVSLQAERKSAIISVTDQGVGIPHYEREKIFQKFYRVGNEDTRKAKGTGLGLYIVKFIVSFHKGEIKVDDNHPEGSIFKVILPLKKFKN
jgi:signal transduction histidine kinase